MTALQLSHSIQSPRLRGVALRQIKVWTDAAYLALIALGSIAGFAALISQ